MKMALIADIHGNLPALQAVLADARARGAERFAFLGDYSLGLIWPNEVLDILQDFESQGAAMVRGNEEDYFTAAARGEAHIHTSGQFAVVRWYYDYITEDNLAFQAGLSKEQVLAGDAVPEGAPPVRMFHKPQRYFDGASPCTLNPQTYAAGIDAGMFTDKTYAAHAHALLEQDALLDDRMAALPAGVYAFGHTHIQWQWRHGSQLLVNPGSCGLPLDFDRRAPYALLEWTDETWHAELLRVPYDVDGTVAAVQKAECAQKVPVWCGVLNRELETAREQAIPFLQHTEAFANAIGDTVRPFCHKTWNAAYAAWVAQGLSSS